MGNQSVLAVFVTAAVFVGSGLAQEGAPQRITTPDLPSVTVPPLNTSATDVPEVRQPTAGATAKPGERKSESRTPAGTSPPQAIAAKTPVTPAIDIPDEWKTKVNIATQHVRGNQLAEALVLFTEILAAKPDLFTISVERGKLYQSSKDHTKAIAHFTAAIARRPDYVDAYFRRCLSHYQTGANNYAINDCSKAIELNNGPSEYFYYRGLAHTANRAWEKAAADLSAATARNNEQPDAHLQLARIYFELEQLIPSLREYTIAIQQRPGYSEAYKGRSAVKAALGDRTGSQEDLGKIAR